MNVHVGRRGNEDCHEIVWLQPACSILMADQTHTVIIDKMKTRKWIRRPLWKEEIYIYIYRNRYILTMKCADGVVGELDVVFAGLLLLCLMSTIRSRLFEETFIQLQIQLLTIVGCQAHNWNIWKSLIKHSMFQWKLSHDWESTSLAEDKWRAFSPRITVKVDFDSFENIYFFFFSITKPNLVKLKCHYVYLFFFSIVNTPLYL